jgi:hypothetical protein
MHGGVVRARGGLRVVEGPAGSYQGSSLKARLEATRALAELVEAGGEKKSVSATVGAYAIWCDGGPSPQTRAPPPAASVKLEHCVALPRRNMPSSSVLF